MRKLFSILLFGLFLSVVSCGRQPSGVIGNDEMVDLLVDVYTSEALTQDNVGMFDTGEKKEALYNSVLNKHGVTRQQFDTSLYWYGQNAEIFNKINEKVTERLKDKRIEIEASASEMRSFALQGDSVNIWRGRSRYSNLLPHFGTVIDYETVSDTSFKPKDMYTFEMLISGISGNDSVNLSQIGLKVRYAKDSTVALRKNIVGNGPISLTLVTDSLVPQTISGYIYSDIDSGAKHMMFDRIRLVRIRDQVKRDGIIPLTTEKSPEQEASQPKREAGILPVKNPDLSKPPTSSPK